MSDRKSKKKSSTKRMGSSPSEEQMTKDDSKFENIIAILERNGIYGSNGGRRGKLAREIMDA